MNRSLASRSILGAAFALAALALAPAAQARTDVAFSIGVQVPVQSVYVDPAPVYVAPEPVYAAPRAVYSAPAPVYVQPRTTYVYADDFERERAWRRAQWRRWHRMHAYDHVRGWE